MVTCSSGTSLRIAVVTLLVVPAFIFWLWLMQEAVRAANQCPEECWCSVNGIRVDCTNASLKNIPSELHNEIRDLTLDHNNIPILRTEEFINSDLIELQFLSIEYSGIRTVEPGAFRGLSKLTDLHLHGNNITVQPGIFSYLSNLERLYLENNNIKLLYSTIFVNLNNLLHLSLEENEITYIDSEVFIGLNNLKSLYLGGNKITQLQLNVFKYMPNLASLSLKNNKKLIIPTERPFLSVPNLDRFLLSGCNIKRLSPETFELSPNLDYIDLANNSISTLELNILRNLPQLKTLRLYGNPLNCDCRLWEVWQWCQDHEIKVGVKNYVPRCTHPTKVSGLWWGVLGKAQCSREHIIEFQGEYQSVIHEYIPSSPKYEEHIKFITYVESSVYAVLFLIGAVGNITLLIIIGCNKRMRTLPNAYIFNLAVGDLLSLTINLPIVHVATLSSQWLLGEFMCKLIAFSHYLSIGVTAFSVSVLSMQRYYATSGSVNSSTKRATLITISSVWIIAFGSSLPAVFSFDVKGEGYCSPFFGFEYFRLVTTFHLLVFCIIPLCVIVCMYIMTARQLILRAQQTEEDSRSYKTLANIVISISIVFFLSYVPYHVLWTVLVWNTTDSVSIIEYLRFISLCLLVLNSCLNPIALCCASVTFRKLFKYYLFCCRTSITADSGEPDLSERKEKSVHYKKDIVTEAAIL